MSKEIPTSIVAGSEKRPREYRYEWSEEEKKLINNLQEKGPKDQETFQMLNDWTEKGEKIADESSDPNARIEFELKRARLYFESGFMDFARESFDAAGDQAYQEYKEDLCDKITKEINKLGLR